MRHSSRRAKRPFPNIDVFASLDQAVTTPAMVAFVQAFARRVANLRVEVMWTAVDDGEVIESVGTEDGVELAVPTERLVVAEIHNHPDPRDQRHAFLHLSDIAASLASGARVFGTYLVLVQAPDTPYVVACRFNGESIDVLRSGMQQPHDALFSIINGIHGSDGRSRRFVEKVQMCSRLSDLVDLYRQALPMLEFCAVNLSGKSLLASP